MNTRGRRRFQLSSLARGVVTVVLVLITISPLYWLVTLSTLSNAEVVSTPPRFLPNPGNFGPIVESTGDPIGTWLLNSVIVALVVAALSVGLAVFPAFAL